MRRWLLLCMLLLWSAAVPAEEQGVPEVVGLEVRSAVEVLRAKGFRPVPRPVTSKSPARRVKYQEPAPGRRLEPGSEVVVYYAVPPQVRPEPEAGAPAQAPLGNRSSPVRRFLGLLIAQCFVLLALGTVYGSMPSRPEPEERVLTFESVQKIGK